MMRMMKRAAVGILAAAMALSMLTACGGASAGPSTSGSTSTGGSGSSSSSSGTNSGSSSSSSSGSTSTKGDTTKLPDGTEIAYQNSKAYQYNHARLNSSSWYTKMERTYVNAPSMNSIQEEASTGKKRYIKTTYPNRNNGKTYEYFYDDKVYYNLYPDLKIAMNYVTINDNSSSSGTTGETYFLTSVQKATHVENKVPYYAEILSYKGKTSGKTMSDIYCFDNSGKLAYTIYNKGSQNECIIRYLSYGTSIPSTAILSIPNDWEVYTSTYDESTKKSTVTDKSGRTLSDEDITALYRKINNRS